VQFNYGGAATVTAPLPTTGGFHHYAATYDGTTSALYVDGQKSSKTTASDGVARTTSFSVGARSDGNEKFPGAIDEVAVYGRVLTPLELVKHIEAR
jgi:hypothetical protein